MKAGIAPQLVALLLVGCAPPRPGVPLEGPHTETTTSGPPPAVMDGGVPRACTHESKDLAPCAEDCDRGIVFACMLLATHSERGEDVPKDLTRSVRLHERACDLGDASSCVNAARMHASGRGVPPSRLRQVELLATACSLGDVHACTVPARAFADGVGVARDERRATELWQRACAGGLESACAEVETH